MDGYTEHKVQPCPRIDHSSLPTVSNPRKIHILGPDLPFVSNVRNTKEKENPGKVGQSTSHGHWHSESFDVCSSTRSGFELPSDHACAYASSYIPVIQTALYCAAVHHILNRYGTILILTNVPTPQGIWILKNPKGAVHLGLGTSGDLTTVRSYQESGYTAA